MKARIALVGPHGAGKSSLAKALAANPVKDGVQYELERLVTSRKRRPNEDNSEYEFITQSEFDAHKDTYWFVQPNRGVDWNYAFPTDRPLADNVVRLYVVVPETAVNLRDMFPSETKIIAILPPSPEVLKRRLTERDATIQEDELSLRLGLSEQDSKVSQQIADAVFYNSDNIEYSADSLRTCIESLVGKE